MREWIITFLMNKREELWQIPEFQFVPKLSCFKRLGQSQKAQVFFCQSSLTFILKTFAKTKQNKTKKAKQNKTKNKTECNKIKYCSTEENTSYKMEWHKCECIVILIFPLINKARQEIKLKPLTCMSVRAPCMCVSLTVRGGLVGHDGQEAVVTSENVT